MKILKRSQVRQIIHSVQEHKVFVIQMQPGTRRRLFIDELKSNLSDDIYVFHSNNLIGNDKVYLYQKGYEKEFLYHLRYELGQPEGYLNIFNARRIQSLYLDLKLHNAKLTPFTEKKERQLLAFIKREQEKITNNISLLNEFQSIWKA